MLIKIVQNGIESDWFQLTKKAHRELIKMKPEAAIIHIEDVYPESPDAGRVIRLDFRLFTVLTREFKLEDLKQEKRDERHVEKLRLEARPANALKDVGRTVHPSGDQGSAGVRACTCRADSNTAAAIPIVCREWQVISGNCKD